MTTTNPGTAVAAPSVAPPLAQQRTSLPAVLTKQVQIVNYRNPQWQTRELTEAERPEIEHWLTRFEAALRPSGTTAITRLLMELALVYGLKGEEEDVQVRLRTMASDLQEFSEHHVAQSIRHHRRECDYFPTIAEMRKLCVHRQATANVYRHRARVLLGLDRAASYEIAAPKESEEDHTLSPSRRKEMIEELRQRGLLKGRSWEGWK